MENPVEIDSLTFGYDKRRNVLTNVSFSVRRGQIVAVMGGSGSGKTTLLRLISGQERASAGAVRVFGRSVADMSRADLYRMRRRIGMLFQFGGLFTDMSLFDNVSFALRHHTDLSESLIKKLSLLKLQAVGLRGAAGLYPSEISGGMARRVALARAVALDPELILYDEPFAGLDPVSLAVTANLIRHLNDALGATSIIVTHDVQESFSIVDYVYLMWQGSVVSQGAPAEMNDSNLPVVRQFVRGEIDGPLPFHYPARPPAADFLEAPACLIDARD